MYHKTQMTSLELLSAVGNLSIQDTLSLRAYTHPDKRLFTFLGDDGHEDDHLTYFELWQRASSIASYLNANTEKGDRVLLFYPQGLDFIAAFFGCLLANRVAVPVNLPNKRRVDKCLSVISDSGATAAMAPQKTYEKLISSFTDTEASSLLWIQAEEIPNTDKILTQWTYRNYIDLDEIAFLQYTSGSTSAPKGVMVTHRNLAVNLQMMRDSWCLSEQSDMVFWQPHHHDMGLIMGQLLPIFLGNHAVIMSPNTAVRQPAIWLHAISHYRAKLSGGPNFIYDLAVARYSEKRMQDLDLSEWEIAPNGADVVRSTTLDRFYTLYKKHGFRMETFMPCYGLAEGTLFVTGGPTRQLPKSIEADTNKLEADRKVQKVTNGGDGRVLVGCGEPNWETEVAIVDPDTCEECELGTVGEIWVHGRAVAAGYWKNQKATQETFHGTIEKMPNKRFLRTGDIGFIGEDNQLYICGRRKDLIICEGRNLHPEDIEYTILESTDKIRPQSCAVFSYDKDNQQSMVAIIEADRDLKRSLNEQASELRLNIIQSVSDVHGIGLNQIVFIPPATLKKTTSGKVQRSLMKQLFLSGNLETL